MNEMKSKLSKLMVCVLITLLLFNFVFCSNSYVYASSQPGDVLNLPGVIGDIFGKVISGIVGLLTTAWRVKILLIGGVAQTVGSVVGSSAGLTAGSTITDYLITPEQIFFNKLNITSINFFDFGSGTRSDERAKNTSSNMVLCI